MLALQAECPPDEDDNGEEGQIARLEAAAPRLPGAVDALAAVAASKAGSFAFAETASASAYFLPVNLHENLLMATMSSSCSMAARWAASTPLRYKYYKSSKS